MSLCRICESRQGLYKCTCCGRVVCEKDYIIDKKICRVCIETLCERCNKYLSINKCYVCGRNCCEDCLVQVSLVQYICIDCYKLLRETTGG